MLELNAVIFDMDGLMIDTRTCRKDVSENIS